MRVSRILQSKGGDVATVRPECPVMEVVAELRARDIGALVVVDADGALAGIVSERDVIRALAAQGPDLQSLAAADLMTTAVTTCEPQADVHHVMKLMTEGRFRHVPVVAHGRLAGIISIGDVVRARIDELERETEALQHYIAG